MEFLLQGGTSFWFFLTILLLIIEGCTWNLTTIWFAVGALGALLANQLGASPLVQTAVFLLVSCVAVLATKPLVRKWKDHPFTPTNGDRNVGRVADVLEEITPSHPGRVQLDGVSWAAQVNGNYILRPTALCRVVDFHSTTLIVEPYLSEENTESSRTV